MRITPEQFSRELDEIEGWDEDGGTEGSHRPAKRPGTRSSSVRRVGDSQLRIVFSVSRRGVHGPRGGDWASYVSFV